MEDKAEILNVLCQLKSSQNSKIQPKMKTLGDYWPSVKCSDESLDQRNHVLSTIRYLLVARGYWMKQTN